MSSSVGGDLWVDGRIYTGAQFYAITTTAGLLDGTKLVAGSIGASTLASGAVTESGLANGAVTSEKIGAGAVVQANIADGAVTSAKITSSAVATSQLASNAVTSAKILDGTIVGADIADNTIASVDVQDGSLAGTDIQDASIAAADLASSSVTTAKIADTAVSAAKLNTTATYRIGKLGVNTDVPQGGVGYAKMALHGTYNSLDCPQVQFTATEDAYPIMTLTPFKHNDMGIRFDCYLGPYEQGVTTWQRSSLAASNAAIVKSNNLLNFLYSYGNDPGTDFSWGYAFAMSCTDGSIKMQQIYDDQVGANRRQLYVDDTGKLGYVSSSIEMKENVRTVAEQDTAFIYNLRPVMFDYKDHALGTNQCGLIAEEVATVCPRVVSYKREVTYEPPADPNDSSGTPTMTVTTTNVPETVNYSELIVPMLAEMQRLQNRVQELETRLAALEATN